MRRAVPFVLVIVLGLAGCQRQETTQSPEVWKAFVGALLIDGRGGAPIPDSVLLVRDGRVEKVSEVRSTVIPADAEIIQLKGEFLIPGLINSHGHVGSTRGLESRPDCYSTETVLRDLELYAHYGVTTVVSLGDDQAPGFEVREDQDYSGLSRTRLYVAGPVLTPATTEEAVSEVRRVEKMEPDFVKIRVDDNLGQTRKMPPEVYRAVIEESHRLGLRVAVHVYYLEDAKELVRAGADFLAHSVRDFRSCRVPG